MCIAWLAVCISERWTGQGLNVLAAMTHASGMGRCHEEWAWYMTHTSPEDSLEGCRTWHRLEDTWQPSVVPCVQALCTGLDAALCAA